MPRTFHRTLIQIEVLSEEYYEPETLEQIASDIQEGDCSGQWNIKLRQELSGHRMALYLKRQGSDPEFFGLDEHGNDIEEVVEE